MTSETKKRLIYVLIGLGFAGLIGAHEVVVMLPDPGADPNMTIPFVLATGGTLSFVAAGLMGFRLLKGK